MKKSNIKDNNIAHEVETISSPSVFDQNKKSFLDYPNHFEKTLKGPFVEGSQPKKPVEATAGGIQTYLRTLIAKDLEIY